MFLISIVYTVYITGVSSIAGFAVLVIFYPLMVILYLESQCHSVFL